MNPIWSGLISAILAASRYCSSCGIWFKVSAQERSSSAICSYCGKSVPPPLPDAPTGR